MQRGGAGGNNKKIAGPCCVPQCMCMCMPQCADVPTNNTPAVTNFCAWLKHQSDPSRLESSSSDIATCLAPDKKGAKRSARRCLHMTVSEDFRAI